MKKCSYCGRENDDESVLCKECGTELPNEQFSPTKQVETSKPEIACPNCGESENLEQVVFVHRKFNWSIFFFGGILSVVFLNGSRPKRFHCKKCETTFPMRTFGAKVMVVFLMAWLLLIWLPFLICLVLLFLRK